MNYDYHDTLAVDPYFERNKCMGIFPYTLTIANI